VTADEIRALQRAAVGDSPTLAKTDPTVVSGHVVFALYEIALQLAEHSRLEIEVDRLNDELYHLKTEGE